jgi:hypothetical protein
MDYDSDRSDQSNQSNQSNQSAQSAQSAQSGQSEATNTSAKGLSISRREKSFDYSRDVHFQDACTDALYTLKETCMHHGMYDAGICKRITLESFTRFIRKRYVPHSSVSNSMTKKNQITDERIIHSHENEIVATLIFKWYVKHAKCVEHAGTTRMFPEKVSEEEYFEVIDEYTQYMRTLYYTMKTSDLYKMSFGNGLFRIQYPEFCRYILNTASK